MDWRLASVARGVIERDKKELGSWLIRSLRVSLPDVQLTDKWNFLHQPSVIILTGILFSSSKCAPHRLIHSFNAFIIHLNNVFIIHLKSVFIIHHRTCMTFTTYCSMLTGDQPDFIVSPVVNNLIVVQWQRSPKILFSDGYLMCSTNWTGSTIDAWSSPCL